MNIADLRAIAHPASLEHDTAPLLRIDGDEEAAGVARWFGEDRARHGVTLVVAGEHVGYIERADVLELVRPRSMGIGDSGRTTLPGATTDWQAILLRCEEADCPDSPIYVVRYDPHDPATCAVHGLSLTPA